MVIKHSNIHPVLKDFVSRIMLIHYQLDTSTVRPVNPFPPQPEHCLYFYPYDKVICHNSADQSTSLLPQSIIVGPQLSLVHLSMGYNTLVIYVGFQPGGLHRLLGVPMDRMCDRSFDSTLFLSRESQEVNEQINAAKGYDEALKVVESFLLKKVGKLKAGLPIDKVLALMTTSSQLPSVDALADQACVSVRQLERQFKERIGMSPKIFMRLVRFSRAWNMHETLPHLSWTHIAHALQYADHMHMIKDFKQFSGTLPTHLQQDLQKSPLRLQGEIH